VEEQETFELEKTSFKAQRAARGSREQELRNKIIARALARWTHLSLSGALSAWYSALQASRTQREAHRRLMARTVGRWTHQALAGAYALFTQHAAEQRRLRCLRLRSRMGGRGGWGLGGVSRTLTHMHTCMNSLRIQACVGQGCPEVEKRCAECCIWLVAGARQ